MKKSHAVVALISFLTLFSLFVVGQLKAENYWQDARENMEGKTAGTTVVTMAAGSSVTIVAADTDRPNMTGFNRSACTLFISTGMPGLMATTNGFPILASTTFNMRQFAGPIAGTLPSGCSGDVPYWKGIAPSAPVSGIQP